MSTKLQKAENLLYNERATDRDLRAAVVELENTFRNHGTSFDRKLQRKYAEVIVRLNLRRDKEKSLYVENSDDVININVPKKETYNSNSSNYTMREAISTRIDASQLVDFSQNTSALESGVSLDSIDHFSKVEFMPDHITTGMHIWTNYANVNYVKDTPRIKVMKTQKADFLLAKEIPQGWIGDFIVLSAKTTNGLPALEVEPVIYLDKIKKLFEFYSQEAYVPWKKGEFFWTKVPPTKVDFKPSNNYSDESELNESILKPKKLCDYKTEVKGLAIFIERFSDEDAHRVMQSGATVFDFILSNYSYNRRSGRAIFVQNSPRATVMANMDKYLMMEK